MKRKIFGSIAAQHDNLGDIVIRRTALRAYLANGHEAVIFTGNMPPGYIDAFEFSERVSLTSNALKFQFCVLSHALTRRAHFIFAPGPHILSDKWRSLAKSSALVLTVAAVRLTGGKVFVIGRSLRGSARISSLTERSIARMSTTYAVRDTASDAAVGTSLERVPDLAFAHMPAIERDQQRKLVGFSFRNDSQINVEALTALVDRCQSDGFRVVLVSQVQRDDEQHSRLAKLLSVEAVLWGKKTHLQQEEAVEKLYSQCQAVISNRLHALLLGAVAGAIPVEFRIGQSDKIQSTLKPWISQIPVLSNSGSPDQNRYDFLAKKRNSTIVQEVESARVESQRILDKAAADLQDSTTN